MDIELIKEKAYVEISTYRVKVVKALGNDIKIPTQLSKDSGVRTNHISKVLKELKLHGIVECINEEAKKGRLYRLTEKGLKLNEMIEGV